MNDPIVTEVRRIREQRAARFGFDLKRIMADAGAVNALPAGKWSRSLRGV